MNLSDPAELRDALLTTKSFLIRMTVHKAHIAISGPNELAGWNNYEAAAAALTSMELRLVLAVDLAKRVAPELQDKLKSFADKSPLALGAAEIPVLVQIAQPHGVDGSTIVVARKVATALSYFVGGGVIKKLFSKRKDMPDPQLLIDIERLLPLVDSLAVAAQNAAAKPETTA